MPPAAALAYVPAPAPHIRVDAAGVAWIDDANVKVIEIVVERRAYGWSLEEVHFQHPGLSLAKIHAALAWYYDHQAEIDAKIAQDLEDVEAMMAQAGESPLQARLRAKGLLR